MLFRSEECMKYEESQKKHKAREEVLSNPNTGLYLVFAEGDPSNLLGKVIMNCADNNKALELVLDAVFENTYTYSKGTYIPTTKCIEVSADLYCSSPCVAEILVEGTKGERLLESVINYGNPSYEQHLYLLNEVEGKELSLTPVIAVVKDEHTCTMSNLKHASVNKINY